MEMKKRTRKLNSAIIFYFLVAVFYGMWHNMLMAA